MSYLVSDYPSYTNGIFSNLNNNYGYILFTSNSSLTFQKNTNCDILIIGAGGRGGIGSYSGGGGAGEVIYYPSYTFSSNFYNIQIGSDSSITSNRISKITSGANEVIKANGGGDGASYIEKLTANNSSYNISKSSSALINEYGLISLNIGNNNIILANNEININSVSYYQYLPILNNNPYFWGKLIGNGNDSSGNNYNFVNVGTPVYNTSSVSLSTSNYITLSADANMNLYTIWNGYGITISLWVKLSSTSGSYSRIFDFSTGVSPATSFLIYKNSTSTNIGFRIVINSAVTDYATTGANYFNNTWVHIVWSISTTGAWKIYINNSLVSNNLTCVVPNITYDNRFIGRSPFTSDGWLVGEIKDFRIYRSVLADIDVSELYTGRVDIFQNSTSGGSGGGGYYKGDFSYQRYIPKAPTSSTTEVSNRTLNGITCYGLDITLDTSGITYGSGTYQLYYSSIGYSINSIYNPSSIFNFNNNPSNSDGHFQSAMYNITTGLYLGTRYLIDSNYKGEWIVIKFPSTIIMNKYKFTSRNYNINGSRRSPKKFRIYGSTDGISWTILDDVNITDKTEYTNYIFEKEIFNNISFNYYCLTINEIFANNDSGILNFVELEYYEKILTINPPNINNFNLSSFNGTPLNNNYSLLSFGNDGNYSRGGNGGSTNIMSKIIKNTYRSIILNNNLSYSYSINNKPLQSINQGTYSAFFDKGYISFGESPYVRPWGAYFANDFSGTTLFDSSGNGRHATISGTISIGTSIGNGASGAINYISGGITSTITWPIGSIPSNFTILSLTRYTGGTRARLLTSVTGNWLHGHYYNSIGVCYYEGWKTPQATTTTGNLDDWLCCIGKNSGTTPNNILADGLGVGNATGGTGNYQLSINTGTYGSTQKSDWALSCVIIYDSQLSDVHMTKLNNFINTYKTSGNINELKSNILSIIDNSYPILENKVLNYTEEREYPSKTFDSSITQEYSSGDLFNIIPATYIKQIINLTNDGISYGSGDYIIYSSSITGTENGRPKSLMFDKNISNYGGWAFNYDSANSGYYLSSRTSYIKSDYLGDWIIIELPNPIILTKFQIYRNTISRSPALWRFYGSNDGINWTEIIEASNNINALTSNDYLNGYYEKVLSPSITTEYKYLGFTINKIVGSDTTIIIKEFKIFGKEINEQNINIFNPSIWYKFDDNSNNMIFESSLNTNYNLTLFNNPTFDNTNFVKGNGSIFFNNPSTGSIQKYAVIPNTILPASYLNSLNVANGLSFSFWIKLSSSSIDYNRILYFGNFQVASPYYDNTNYRLQIRTSSPKTTAIYFDIVKDGFYTFQYNANMYDDTWKHIVWTISSTGVWNIYVNNSLICNNQSKIVFPLLSSTNLIYILGVDKHPTNYGIIGNFDDFRIYNKTLTLADVQELYNGRIEISYKYYENLTLQNLSIGTGGTGATSNSTPVIKNNFGDGGDGNGGLGYNGAIIIKFPFENSIGNSNFSSNIISINDKNIDFPYFNDINQKPSFCNICFSANYNDIITNKPNLNSLSTSSNLYYSSNSFNTSYSNINYTTSNNIINFNNNKLNNLSSSLWINSGLNIYSNLGSIGIGTSSFNNNKLVIKGNLKADDYKLKGTNISNIFITSNTFDNKSNSIYNSVSNQDYISKQTQKTSSQFTTDINKNLFINYLSNYSYYSNSFTSLSNSFTIPEKSQINFNYSNQYFINSGTYNVIFDTGSIITNYNSQITDKSYPILKDTSGNNINPIAWYKLDNNFLTIDSSGNNNNLVNVGSGGSINTTIFIKGNGSAYFNNTANYFRNTSIINNDVPISFSFWFNCGTANNNTMVSYNDNLGNPVIQFDYTGNVLIVYTALNTTWSTSPQSSTLNLNTWYHVVYTLNNNNPVNANLYINGSLVSTANGNANQTLKTNRGYVYLGYSGDKLRGYNGYLDDLRLYNFSLTSNQVQELYNGRVDILQQGISYGLNAYITGTGNTINISTDNNNYRYALFISNGTFVIDTNITCDILVVGGGGGGGIGGGGGGAGAVLYTTNFNLSSGTYSIVVGSGGAGSTGTSTNGTNGNNSSITINGTTYIALGGGGGGTRNDPASYTGRGGNNGGSGGGGSHSDNSITTNIGGSSTKNTYASWTSLGNAGGDGKDGYANGYGSGGGGGAGSIGTIAGANSGGNGGSGVNLSSIFGNAVGQSGWFGGGGGGGSYSGTSGQVGYGNGGNGLLGGGGNAYAGNGIAYTGGGGGGGDFNTLISGSGGSGVVIIRYLYSSATITSNSNSLVFSSNSIVKFNYSNDTNFNIGTYNINFSTGSININSNFINDKSYPILKDINKNNINPIAWYKFDDTTNLGKDDTNTYNLINNNSVFYNSTNFIKGTGCCNFNGTNKSLTNSSAFNLNSKDFSISCWLYTTLNNSYNFFLCIGSSTATRTRVLLGYFNNNTYIFSFSSDDLYSPVYTEDLNKWVHICATYKTGTRIRKIYRNGIEVASGTSGGETNSTTSFFLGKIHDDTAFYNGNIDDFRIYDRELTSSQVQELYNGRVDIFLSNQKSSNVGIGTSSISNDIITIAGNLNVNDLKIKNNNLSNILITSNIIDNYSNNIINYFNSKYQLYNSTYWINSNSSIYLSSNGNIGIGSIIPKEKLDIFGNLNINGKILPNSCNSFDLGSSNKKFKDLYLSGNSIYLNDISIKNSNNYLSSSNLNINQINFKNTNGINKTISLNTNGDFMIENKYLLAIDNRLQLSNIVLSNVFNNSSNYLFNLNNSNFNSFNSKSTDLIPIGNNNRFITNDIYNRQATFTGTIQSYNLITSNLNVIGDTTTFNTTIYQTEQLFIANSCNYPAMIIKQMNINKNVAELYTSNLPNINTSITGTGNIINTANDNINYRYALFTSNGTFTINNNIICDILVVGGGGGGSAGGGGAGGFVYRINQTLSSGTYNIIVGNGGTGGIGGNGSTRGNDGNDSYIQLNSVDILRAYKGAGGANNGQLATAPTGYYGSTGGCGHDSGRTQNTFPAGTLIGGNIGGVSSVSPSGNIAGYQSSGGGGGAGGVGQVGIAGDNYNGNYGALGGAGGIGIQNSITGISTYYAGGGAGGTNINSTTNSQTIRPQGGLGGGGNGNLIDSQRGTDGIPNTGGGGGGSDWDFSSLSGSGGSGVVIIRYLLINSNNQIRFLVNSNGNVGIGTINPISKLNVIGNVNSTGLIVNNNEIINFIKTNDNNYSNSIYNSWNYSNNLYSYSSNSFLNINNSKQALLNSSSIILGIGNNISNINYSNIINKPDLSIYSSSVNSNSNLLFSNLSNLELNSSNSNISFINTSINNLVKFQWITNGNNVYTNSNVGIGSTNPTMNLDIIGNLNANELLIKKGNISNIFITSNTFEDRSNNYFSSFSNRDFISSNSNISYINTIVNSNLLNNNTDIWKYGNNFLINFNYLTSIIANNNSLTLTINSLAIINYINNIIINNGSYNVVFNNGNIIINSNLLITDKSYPILKDNIYGNTINPIIWYKFDGSSSQMLLDNSGSYNLINNGATYDTTNFIKGNGSVNFNHSLSQYLSIPSINLYNIQSVNGISFCLWFRMNTTNTGVYPRLFDFSSGNTSVPRWILISRHVTNNTLNFDIANTANPSGNRITTNTYIDGNWHHIVWSINNLGTWVIYIDGVIASFTASLPTNINIENVNFTSNSLGKSLYNSDGYLSGNIDDFRIYNYVITSNQVKELYNGRVDILQQGLTYGINTYITGTGNTINISSDNNNYRYALFTTNGTFNIDSNIKCDILVVGGGGSGGGYSGGGGGGDVIYKSNFNLNSGIYNINIGNGGIAPRSGSDNYINGNSGETSSITSSISGFIPIYAAGGGGGIGYNKSTPTITPTAGSIIDGNYSSGGGGGAGSDSQNFSSGSGNSVSGNGGKSVGIYGSGGGGGATGNGGDAISATNTAGAGGTGYTSSITGVSIGYGGGGGGSSWTSPNANLGTDGGGNGGRAGTSSATDGTTNRGGGGGGAPTTYNGGNGGSGVVIIRYLYSSATITTNSNSLVLSSNSIVKFNYSNDTNFNIGTYNINFLSGSININSNLAIDKSYPLLKDNNDNIINPISWYKFDDSTNLGKDDMNIYNLTPFNTPVFNSTTFIKGTGSCSFNGTNQYLNKTSAFNLNSKDFSICFWINRTSNGRHDEIMIIGSSMTSSQLIDIAIYNTNQIAFNWWQQDFVSDNSYLDAGTWVHLCFTYKTGIKIKTIYRNGVIIKTGSILNEVSTTNDIRIGVDLNSRYFSGLLDDFRIYNFELSSSQVQELYNGRVNIYTSNITNNIFINSNINCLDNIYSLGAGVLNNTLVSTNNSFVLSNNYIAKINYNDNINLKSGTYKAVFNNGSITLDETSYIRPWGAYFADDWSGTTLLDSSGNGRHATTSSGNITKTTGIGNGATGAITYIYGGTSSTISWPSGSIPTNFTILSLTRYNGGTRKRILDATSINWLHGHWGYSDYNGGGRGRIFYEKWLTDSSSTTFGILDDWLCCIGKNGGTNPNNILLDGTPRGISTGGTGNSTLRINGNGEPSDWALSAVIIYDSILSDDYMVKLNNFINNYKSSGNIIELKSNILSINNKSYPILKDISGNNINPILWYKFDGSSTFLNETFYSSNIITNNGSTFDNTSFIKGDGSIKFVASSSQYAIIPNNFNWNAINSLNGISFSWWAKNNSSTGTYGRLWDFGNRNTADATAGSRYIMVSKSGTTSNHRFDISNPAENSYGYLSAYTFDTTGTNYFDGVWRHYVWTISSTGIWNIYINNSKILDNVQKIAIPTMSGTIYNYLGKSLYNGDGYYDGNIDDFRIYNFVLAQSQIDEIYKGRIDIYNINNNNLEANILITSNINTISSNILTISSNSYLIPNKSIVKFNYINDFYINSNIYDINFNNGNIGFGESPYVKTWGAYFADDWSGTTLLDSSGNGRHATTSSGNIIKTSGIGNGATGAITYIYGGTTATITWPSGSIPTNFTILSLTRYNGATKRRLIVSAGTGNWLHGHYLAKRGVCHYEKFITADANTGTDTDWLCCIGKNGGTTPNNILIDGVSKGNDIGGTGGYSMGVNNDQFGTTSDWALSAVIIYDSHLSDAHMVKLNNFINTYKSSGNIIELKSNILRNIDNSYPILKERQYPPKLYDSITAETTTTEILGKTTYKQTLTLNTTGISYGSGDYIIYSSSTYNSLFKNLLFDYNLNNVEGSAFQALYTSGIYNSTNFILSNYLGDWIIIKLPVSIILTRFSFQERSGLTSRAPAEWKCYGSIDGITFTEITQASQMTRLTASNYVNGFYTKSFLNTTPYLYIGFTINKIVGGANDNMINFSELQLFGKETIDFILNPTAWYKFDDNTNIGLDSSGNGYNLTNNNNVVSVSGIKGKNASSFNTTNNLTITNGIDFSGKSFSISYWQYAKTNISGFTSSFGNNLSKVANNSIMVGYGTNISSTYFFGFWGNDYYSSAYSNDVNNWVFLTYTYNSSTLIRKIYRNGVYIGGDTSSSQLTQNGATICIGNIFNVTGYSTNGFYDDFRIYNGVELAQSQIQELYQGRIDIHDYIYTSNYSSNLLIKGDLNIIGNIKLNNTSLNLISSNVNVSITGTGNTINIANDNSNFRYAFFANNGTFTLDKNIVCDILIIGGGGSGGPRSGGGGGAGALIYLTNQLLSSGTYNINIGSGGTGVSGITNGNDGNDTYIQKNSSNIYLAKGGGSGTRDGIGLGRAGGSSAGTASGIPNISYAPLTTNIPSGTYGNYGGAGSATYYAGMPEGAWTGGGGGGAGSIGGNATLVSSSTAGNGGNGRQINITGINTYYAGGGGGGANLYSISAGNGGLGGGGAGVKGTGTATSGTANTGGGGGGAGFEGGGNGISGAGGSGVVIIRYNINQTNYNGAINYSNIQNRPYMLDLLTSSNIINVRENNNINFPLSLTSWKNEWNLFIGTSPTNIPNSFIFHHLTSTINSKWWFNGTTSTTKAEISDNRIKKEIKDITNGLDILMLINPKEYYLCDDKDYHKKYGIIAQDIYQIPELNHLVYKDEDYIANVYSFAFYYNSNENYIISSLNPITNLININDELKILLDNNNNQEIIIEELTYQNRYKKRFVKVKSIIDDYSFEIFNDIELNEDEKIRLFIYGKKINDFHKLDYNSLYTLNISANQEIYDIINNTYKTLDNLTTIVKNLENKLL